MIAYYFLKVVLNVSMTCLFFAIENFIIILGIENVVKCKIQEMLRKILLR